MLWATNKDLKETFIKMPEQFAKVINRRTVNSSIKQVYASVNARWITSMLRKKYPASQLV